MLEVHTWQPNANSGKPLFCLHEKGVPFTYHDVRGSPGRPLASPPTRTAPRARNLGFAMPQPVTDWLDHVAAWPRFMAALGPPGALRDIATMGPERGRRG